MAAASPARSESGDGSAPGVSISVINGRFQRPLRPGRHRVDKYDALVSRLNKEREEYLEGHEGLDPRVKQSG